MSKAHLENPIQITVKDDDSLPRITQKEFLESGDDLLQKEIGGHQFAVVDDKEKIVQVVGMNGRRLLPEPDNNLLQQIIEPDTDEDDSNITMEW